MTGSLQARLDAHKAASRAKQDVATAHALDEAIRSLRASHPASSYIAKGAVFPDFDLPDSTGGMFRLGDALSRGPVVLSFYRGGWCPYCNLELDALAGIHSRLRGLGAELVAISPQTAANSERAIRRGDLPFRILVDAGNRVAAAAGLRYVLEPDVAALYASLGVNLPLINGDASLSLPIPARIIVARDGRVASISADPDYTRRPEPMDTLRELESLAASAAMGSAS